MNADKSLRWGLVATTGIALVVLTIAVYWPVFQCDFVNIDDNEYVSANGPVLQGLSTYGWIYAWTTLDMGNWNPLTWLSFELDTSLWGPKPFGYHTTNLILHTANVLLLYLLLYQLSTSVSRSAVVAALFAVHPLHVESVAWITERKDVLCTFFLLLTLFAYCHYAKRPSMIRYLAVFVLFFLGLCAKPMLVTLPVLLVLFDEWPLRRIRWRQDTAVESAYAPRTIALILIEKIPLLCLSLADGIITIIAQQGATKVVKQLTFVDQLANVFNSYFWYLWKTFVPTDLSVYYPHPGSNVPWITVSAGGIIVVLITLWALWQSKRHPWLLFGWGWFVISLLPVIGLLQVGGQAYADRYTYIPHLGLFIGLVWWCHAWIANSRPLRIGGCVAAILAVAMCSGLTHRQIGFWRNSHSLWKHALEVNPDSGIANLSFAGLLMMDGEYERAIAHLEKGITRVTTQPQAASYFGWGSALTALNREAEAEEKFRTAIQIAPDYVPALDALWKLYLKQQRQAEADQTEKEIIRALVSIAEKKRYSATSQAAVGHVELVLGHPEKALPYFERAVLMSPRDANALCGLATAQLELKRLQEAKTNLRRAIGLAPGLATAHFKLGEILEFERDLSGARRHFEQAVRLEPGIQQYRARLAPYINR